MAFVMFSLMRMLNRSTVAMRGAVNYFLISLESDTNRFYNITREESYSDFLISNSKTLQK